MPDSADLDIAAYVQALAEPQDDSSVTWAEFDRQLDQEERDREPKMTDPEWKAYVNKVERASDGAFKAWEAEQIELNKAQIQYPDPVGFIERRAELRDSGMDEDQIDGVIQREARARYRDLDPHERKTEMPNVDVERQQAQALHIQNTSKPSVPAPEEEAERPRRQQRI